ncbi:MAG: redoxin domain-containing protein [Gammaproteobacteria bacterium]|jgi:thiol-disulfide isomerase/thioredoxin
MAESLAPFKLNDQHDAAREFPGAQLTLLCFLKEDCPTCQLTLPVLERVHAELGDRVDVLGIGQDVEGNRKLVDEQQISIPLLDDSALKVSFDYDIDIVPTVVLADVEGEELMRFEGFDRADWQTLLARASELAGKEAPMIEWDEYPVTRPGCGSKSVEPGVRERLEAESRGSPLRARRIDVGEGDDVSEFLFDQGLTDGLPVVAPTPERVLKMLTGTRRDPQEIVAVVPPNMAPVTVEKVAINAVMAGCKPEFLPVILTALEAVCTEEFNVHGVMATTMGASPVMIVNGPIRERLGMNMRLGALGQGNRANATMGRALRLVLRNMGGARPGGTERSTLGNPMKFTMCFPEWEERSPWEPYHVERGFDPEDSTVTVIAMVGGPSLIVDQTSRSAKQLAGSIGLTLEGVSHPRAHGTGDTLLVLAPEHVDTIARDQWSKDDIRERIQEVTSRPVRELLADDVSGVGIPRRVIGDSPTEEQLARRVPKFRSKENIHIVVAGSEAGKFSAVYQGWASGPIGSMPVTRKIEEA